MEKETVKILLVDDQDNILIFLGAAMSSLGYSTVFADNGADAISIAEEESPDLIIMDVVMPGMSGFESCKILKSDSKTRWIPVILISALSRDVDREMAQEVNAEQYLVKPLRLSILKEVVPEIIEESRRNRFTRRLDADYTEDINQEKILYEYNPSSNHMTILKDLIHEANESVQDIFVLYTSNLTYNFPDYVKVIQANNNGYNINDIMLRIKTQGVLLIIYTLTDLILTQGFKTAYSQIRNILQNVESDCTLIAFLAPGAHTENETVGIRTLFNTTIIEQDGIKLVK